VIVGNVFDENMGDGLRVTMVATGLTGVQRRQPVLRVMPQEIMRNGTTNQAVFVNGNAGFESAGADDVPQVFASNSRRAQVEAMKMSGVEEYDIPAFLRKQAD
jgi:cell division protein FtsZ